MTMAKPFYRRKSFPSLVFGVIIISLSIFFIATSFPAGDYFSGMMQGMGLGLGLGFLYAWAFMINLEMELQWKNTKETTSL
jgi:hypothetical protein